MQVPSSFHMIPMPAFGAAKPGAETISVPTQTFYESILPLFSKHATIYMHA